MNRPSTCLKLAMRLAIGLPIGLAVCLGGAMAQTGPGSEIRFEELKRPAPEVVRRVTVPGVASEALEHARAFVSEDTARREELQRFRAAAAGSDSGRAGQGSTSDNSSGSDNNKKKAAAPSIPKVYSCTIYCKSSSGPTIRRDFPAQSRRDAARIAGDSADQLCGQAGLGMGNPRALPEGQCHER